MQETIFQHWIITQFVLPFLLVWTIVFAILEKTKILGEGKKQLDSLIAFIIGLIFVGAIFPKLVVGNMILFLTVALIVMFVALLLWGFVSGGEVKESFLSNKGVKWVLGIVVVISVIIAVLYSTDIGLGIFSYPFVQTWSSSFWTNAIFIIVVAVALSLVLKSSSKSSS